MKQRAAILICIDVPSDINPQKLTSDQMKTLVGTLLTEPENPEIHEIVSYGIKQEDRDKWMDERPGATERDLIKAADDYGVNYLHQKHAKVRMLEILGEKLSNKASGYAQPEAGGHGLSDAGVGDPEPDKDPEPQIAKDASQS